MSTEPKRLSKREWWLIILVIVIGEYLFIDKVFKYGADAGIVSYVSFAGTIVSIILAVLAIVYSYYQNFSQQRDSNNIATQIDLLRNTVKDVRVSKDEFISELERINSISEKLDQSMSILAESQSHVIKLSSSFESFRASVGIASQQVLEPPGKEKLSPTQVNYFFKRFPEGTYLILFALYKSKWEKLKFDERFEKYYKAPMLSISKDNDENKLQWDENMIYTVFVTTFFLFQAFGLLSVSKGELTLDGEVENLIKMEIESGNVFKIDYLKKAAKMIEDIT